MASIRRLAFLASPLLQLTSLHAVGRRHQQGTSNTTANEMSNFEPLKCIDDRSQRIDQVVRLAHLERSEQLSRTRSARSFP